MNKLLFTLTSLILFSCSKCQQTGFAGIRVHDTISFRGDTVIFIGNSITSGTGASPSTNRWTTLFSVAKQDSQINMGVNGQSLQNTSSCGNMPLFSKTTIPAYAGQAAMFFSLGINDIEFHGSNYSATGFKATLDSVLDYAINTKGWPSKRIILVTPSWVTNYTVYNGIGCGHTQPDVTLHESYVAAIISEAVIKNTNVADVYTAMKNSAANATFLGGDGVHPNNTGYAFMASFFEGITFYLN